MTNLVRTRRDIGEGIPKKLGLPFLEGILPFRQWRRSHLLQELRKLSASTEIVILRNRRLMCHSLYPLEEETSRSLEDRS